MKKLFLVVLIIFCFGCNSNDPISILVPDFKEYVAVINQKDADSPIANVIKCDFNDSLRYTRIGNGCYHIISDQSIFSLSKTFVTIGAHDSINTEIVVVPDKTSEQIIHIYTFIKFYTLIQHDNLLRDLIITIRVYN
jgi:hypothetical protein